MMTLVEVTNASTVQSAGEHRWTAMGSDVHLIVDADPRRAPSLAAYAEGRVADLERLWSRFLPTSELSALNGSHGRPVKCSPETLLLVESLVNAWRVTDGAFDPTLLGSLIRLGYDVSRREPSEPIELAPDCYTRGRPDEVLIDHEDGLVQLPAGTALDAGGLGKGFAADIVVTELLDRGATGALLSVGGDIAVAGEPADADAWCIEVRPHDGLTPELVRLVAGGIATSSTRRRTWTVDATPRHHLIDPHTGQPTTGPVTGAAVIAGSAATAEAFTKCAFVSGIETAIATYERFGLAGKIWGHAQSRAWREFSADPDIGPPAAVPPTARPIGATR